MIPVTHRIALHEDEIQESFIQSSGPGGQNVNKVATAVQIRFDARNSPSLPEDVRERLMAMAGQRLTKDGVIVITARSFRSQDRNREDAVVRLVELIRRAAVRPVVRRPTRPTRASVKRRLEQKNRRSETKKMRNTSFD
ncbi:ribosome-associated protein [Faunimonas pinastri]|uniref:Ribosome-associated protein n=1 Tax=Faunimonas pinastri TaxID=1855383 RepID=A0A1H9A063_9HYPH|nr:alternative ribosome rescue aminoacyl-tRNA hydrolase ArfB [Faunimonas pinastri]SEP69893.1 ribosome-associated protein [Faunimonas pinastri]